MQSTVPLVLLCFTLGAVCVKGALVVEAADDLPPGVIRGPLLHEHSFQPPLVDDWWEEGVPHFMIGGSAVANAKFMRLTTNSLEDHGFAFNTAPLDHDDWEARVKVSVRPPPPAAEAGRNSSIPYQGGDGLALWYIDQPIGDDHQHVVKYSKAISTELVDEILDMENPWRLADVLLNADDNDGDDDDLDEDDLTDEEKEQRRLAQERRVLKQQKREEVFRRFFKRGTSIDDSDREPRIMGVKYSDFNRGFAVVLDSVGDEDSHMLAHTGEGNAVEHHHHNSTVSVLFNLPDHTFDAGNTIINNFNPTHPNFRKASRLLQCQYDFRQKAYKKYSPHDDDNSEAAKALAAPEEPVELVVRYYKKKLTVILRREEVEKRELVKAEAAFGVEQKTTAVEVRRTYRETLCGELFPVIIPLKYHFGLSASTGHRKREERKPSTAQGAFHQTKTGTLMHVDVHDVFQFELRELGLDAKAMGYSKTVPLEHFDYEKDRREREHFSRQIPVEPDADSEATTTLPGGQE